VATIKQVEKKIESIEGFHVKIRHGRDGSDVRGDKSGIKQYPFERALKGAKNVKEWRDGRFARTFPGFEVQVLNADDKVAHGGTLLTTVRDGYLDD
jgi:hypothetical protein